MELMEESLVRLGRMFYVINPWTTSFAEKHQIPAYVRQAYPWFFTLIILERVILRKKNGRAPPLNDGLVSVCCGLFQELIRVLFRGLETTAYFYIYDNYRLYELPWQSPWTWLWTALSVDCGYYWAHRMAHEVNLFWAQHQVHHSSEEYNLTTALRQSGFQGWCTWMFYLPMAFFIPPSQFLVHLQFNLLYQFWIHTEVIDNLGPLEWVLNTPSHHRVHHGADRYCVDKNYAGVLIIWDRIFGTFEPERRDKKMVYGLIEQVPSFNPFYVQLFYTWKVFQKAIHVPGLINKFSAIFKGPGWMPGTPRLGNYETIPENCKRKKFAIPFSAGMEMYSLVHFILLSVIFERLADNFHDLDLFMKILWTGYIFTSMYSLGMLFNQQTLACWTEMIRCLIIFGFPIPISFVPNTSLSPLVLLGVRAFYFGSAIYWRKDCMGMIRPSAKEKSS